MAFQRHLIICHSCVAAFLATDPLRTGPPPYYAPDHAPAPGPGKTRDAADGSSNVEASRAMRIQCTERNSPLGDVIAHVAH